MSKKKERFKKVITINRGKKTAAVVGLLSKESGSSGAGKLREQLQGFLQTQDHCHKSRGDNAV